MTVAGRARSRPVRAVVLVGAALALVAGCTSNGATSSAPGSGSSAQAAAPTITVNPGKGRTVAPTAPVVIRAQQGKLDMVTVQASDGSVVPGRLANGDTVWRSDPQLLQFGSKYNVAASAVSGSARSTVSSTFTVKESKGLHAFLSPDNRTVGVGMPIIARLTATPDDRAMVESRLSVTTSRPVQGAWHWFSDTELHWRPKDYWPANTTVLVKANLNGVKFGNNVYGDHDTSVKFKIGESNINTVDVNAHTLTVTTNGKLLRVIPVTTGKSTLPTRAGIKVIISKQTETVMDSATVDIPKGSPDAYRLTVKNAMRITWSGEYLHAAPWSVASQGVANVSHGCTGMSDANAQWMFDHSQVGDVVKYVGSTRPLEQGNGYTDWNVPWATWLKNSAV